MVSNGEKASHQLFGAPSRILCCEELRKESLMCPCEASHGQHFGCSVCKSSGGTHSLVLSNLALALALALLWEWALSQGFFLSAEHLSGRLNIAADWQTRHFHDSSNWKLCPEVFRALMLIRGPCAKDPFADRLNAQLPQFFSWKPDPMALASDALTQDWSNGRNYAFLPFA